MTKLNYMANAEIVVEGITVPYLPASRKILGGVEPDEGKDPQVKKFTPPAVDSIEGPPPFLRTGFFPED